MAEQININDLATLSPSALDGDYYGVVFDAEGDTNKVVFEDAVAQANENNGNIEVKEAKITIASADVLQLNSTPQPIGLTVPSGQYPVLVGSPFLKSTYNSTPYATNTTIGIRSIGGANPIVQSNILGFSADFFMNIQFQAPTSGLLYLDGTDLEVFVDTGDPTAGDSDIEIYFNYTLATL